MKKKLVAQLLVALIATSVIPQTLWAKQIETNPEVIQVVNPEEAGSYTQTKNQAEAVGQALTTAFGVPNMQYALMVGGEIVVSGAVNQPQSVASTEETLYGIGSVSKMYTAAAMMKLVDLGKVDLDQPVTKYIPEFVMADERYKEITPRMLLNHSSGLMGSSFEDAFLFEDNDTYAHDRLLESLKGQRLKADPGAYSVYCNDGFTLAEILIERVSGMSFTEFITQHIVEPLGLERTVTPENIDGWKNVATSYSPTYQGPMPKEVTNVIGTGGIYSTAEELCKFGQIFTGEKEILSAEAIEAMGVNEAEKGIWPEIKDGSLDYGLGWDSVELYPFNEYGIKAWMKGGDTLNYHASLIVLPEYDMTVAVTSAGGSSIFDQMAGTQILLTALQEKGDIKEILPAKTLEAPVAAVLPKELQKYAGLYISSGQMVGIAISEEGLLSLIMVGAEYLPAQTFQYTEEGVFVSPDGSTKVSFVEESNGEVYLYVEGYMAVPGLGEVANAYYNAQKVEPSTLSDEERTAWEARNGKIYYMINEKYTSATYQMAMPIVGLLLSEKTPGYMAGYEITGVNKAEGRGQIPGINGRDLMDMTFYEKDGVEYVQLGSNLAIGQEGIGEIYKGSSKCTIGEEGYGRWYAVGEATAGKTMTVKLPETGAFAVYDTNGVCINYTTVSKNPTVTLPVGGKIIFMGDAGTQFEINIKYDSMKENS